MCKGYHYGELGKIPPEVDTNPQPLKQEPEQLPKLAGNKRKLPQMSLVTTLPAGVFLVSEQLTPTLPTPSISLAPFKAYPNHLQVIKTSQLTGCISVSRNPDNPCYRDTNNIINHSSPLSTSMEVTPSIDIPAINR